jgi:hypothetical protein
MRNDNLRFGRAAVASLTITALAVCENVSGGKGALPLHTVTASDVAGLEAAILAGTASVIKLASGFHYDKKLLFIEKMNGILSHICRMKG